ncbi:MAG: nuclease-related domain-containing protein [Planctomycetota bacterium]
MLLDEIGRLLGWLFFLGMFAGFGLGVLVAPMIGIRWFGWLGWGVLLVGLPPGAVWFFKLKARVENIHLGQEGEIYVAQLLEGLRGEFEARQCAVFHDLPGHALPLKGAKTAGYGGPWNIDHVVVGPTGVVAVETKTLRKWDEPGRTQKLHYDGQRLAYNGRKELPRSVETLRQADRGAERVRAILREMTGREFAVRAALVFPGWWVELSRRGAAENGPDGGKAPGVSGAGRWVANPKALVKWIAKEPVTLSREDVTVAMSGLERYARQRMDE